jgi:hypothetical protein
MAKYIEPGGRVMDRGYFRDGDNIHYGEALVLACLLHVRKDRTAKQEEELKEVLGVFEESQTENPRRSKKNKNRNKV